MTCYSTVKVRRVRWGVAGKLSSVADVFRVLWREATPDGFVSKEEFLRAQAEKERTRAVCGRVWGKGYVAYRCKVGCCRAGGSDDPCRLVGTDPARQFVMSASSLGHIVTTTL